MSPDRTRCDGAQRVDDDVVDAATVGDVLRSGCAAHIGGPLLCERASSHLFRVADAVPAGLSRAFGFECRLSSDDRLDLGVKIETDEQRAVLHAHAHAHAHDRNGRPRRGWASLGELAQRWRARGDTGWDGIGALWLEFDACSDDAELGPSLCFLGDFRRGSDVAKDARAYFGAASRVVEGTTGTPVHAGVRRSFERCLEHLPRGAWVCNVGLPLARRSQHVRVNVRGFAVGQPATYLAALGLASSRSVGRVLEVGARAGAVQLGFDLGEAIEPRVHVELLVAPSTSVMLGREVKLRDAEHWRSILRELTGLGVVTEDKAEALADWHGDVRPGTVRIAGRARRFDKRVSHVKLVCDPEGQVCGKGYFGLIEGQGAA